MKLKLFEGKNASDIEQQVNEWLAQHDDIKVLFMNSSTSNVVYSVISILYREFADPGSVQHIKL